MPGLNLLPGTSWNVQEEEGLASSVFRTSKEQGYEVSLTKKEDKEARVMFPLELDQI
jgi:hypothetical protein